MFSHCFFEIILVSSVNVMSFLAVDCQFKIVSIKNLSCKIVCVYYICMYINYLFVFFNLTFCYLYVACILIILSLDVHTEFHCRLFWSLTPRYICRGQRTTSTGCNNSMDIVHEKV